jgi:hypothetical protein
MPYDHQRNSNIDVEIMFPVLQSHVSYKEMGGLHCTDIRTGHIYGVNALVKSFCLCKDKGKLFLWPLRLWSEYGKMEHVKSFGFIVFSALDSQAK